MASLDQVQALKDERGEGEQSVQNPYEGLVAVIKAKWQRATLERLGHERRWLRAYQNYRGIYGPDVQFRESEKSRVFVKITKTKVLAAYGQLLEVLFAGDKFPIGIIPSEKPVGIAEYAHLDPAKKAQEGQEAPGQEQPEEPKDVYGYPGDGNDLPPGATYSTLLGGAQAGPYGKAGFEAGPAPNLAQMIQISPAEISAKEMEKVIQEQLEESDAGTVLRHSVFEMALLGTGIIKGPFTYQRTSHRWVPDDSGQLIYNPIQRDVPDLEAVSCWNFYPDPDALKSSQWEWTIQRHPLGRSAMRALLDKPFFRKEAIRACIEQGPNYVKQWFEDHLRDDISQTGNKERYEVLEYWGVLDRHTASIAGIDGLDTDDFDDTKEVQVNVWICGNFLLRVVLNPFTPAHIPYQVCPYELNPYQLFGIGIPENMDDCQTVMNGHARMAIDNLALAGHLVFDIDEQSLVPGQDMKIYPGKIFRRQAGQPGQAVFGIKFPSTAQDNLMMFDKFRQLSDEATGIPSYSHGATGVQSTTRTASGMSMLMGAAALNIKTVVKNIDDYLLGPLGESYFHWNMQFNKDVPEIRGDLEIKARGTSALMQKEVRSQRLMTFMQIGANPAFAPYIKAQGLLTEIADSLDVDPKKLINDPQEAAIYAMIIGQMNGQGGPQAGQAGLGTPIVGQDGNASSGGPDTGPTGNGNGNIGTGNVPMPGQGEFAANTNQSSPAQSASVSRG